MLNKILVTSASRFGSTFSDRLKFRLSVAFGVWKEGDHRDWNAIRAWAQSLYPLLAPKPFYEDLYIQTALFYEYTIMGSSLRNV